MSLTRRKFLKYSAGLSQVIVGAGLTGFAGAAFGKNTGDKSKIIVIGGGAGGCTVARYLNQINPSLDITLVEKDKKYISAFMNNLVLGGDWPIDKITFDYQSISKRGITVLNDTVTDLDINTKKIVTASGKSLSYDRVILATGTSANVSGIVGLDEQSLSNAAWTTGTTINNLHSQIKSMKKGGKVVLSIPAGDISGFMATYERASQIAYYLKTHNPKAKIIIVDGNAEQKVQSLFKQAWKELYPGMIEFHNAMKTTKVMANSVHAGGNDIPADVINMIAPQQASKLANTLGLTDDSGWCPVNSETFESTKIKNIHVIGDALKSSGDFRKNAQTANGQGKTLALIMNQLLNDNQKKITLPPIIDTEYAILSPTYGVSSSRMLRLESGKWNIVSQGVSSPDTPVEQRKRDVLYAHSWFNNITHEMFS